MFSGRASLLPSTLLSRVIYIKLKLVVVDINHKIFSQMHIYIISKKLFIT